jgi:tetratricopeptide (TPR) repeat protein
LQAYQKTVEQHPNLSAILYPKLAEVYKKEGDYGKARQAYRMALLNAPLSQMASLEFKLAQVLEEEGKIDEALGEYLKVIYLYPQDESLVVKALLRAAQIYENQKKFKQAKNIYLKLADMDVEEAKYARERLEHIEK